jgi:very-short-patch-repair endonuclease
MTDAEAGMWCLLRGRRLMGAKFRRQFPIGSGYVVLRFWNDQVLTNQDSVLDRIAEILITRAPSPAAARRPLPEGEANNSKGTGE